MISALATADNAQLGMTLWELAPNYSPVAFDFKSKKDLDITNSKKINSVFEKNRYDFCINCAAFTKVEQAEVTPEIAFKVNADGAKKIWLWPARDIV